MRQFVACACGLLSAAAVAFAQSPSATETITVIDFLDKYMK